MEHRGEIMEGLSELFADALKHAGYDDAFVLWSVKKDDTTYSGYRLPEDRDDLFDQYWLINTVLFTSYFEHLQDNNN